MKQIVLTLCIFFVFITSAYAGKLYNCIDRDGKAIITDVPQDGMKNCVLKDSYEGPSPEGLATEKEKVIVGKDKAVVKAKETPEARIKNCVSCCANKQIVCYNFTADNRLCTAEIKNCYATCDSGGTSPSSWSDCWSQSDK